MAKILVTDDDAFFRRMVRSMLEAVLHVVVEARDGAACLEILSGEDFDLLIIDMVMPKVDGIEIIRRVRGDGNPVKILVVSGGIAHMPAATSLRMAELLGADDHLVKPFSGPQLYQKVNGLLGK
jgi:CheY-like chemotaxis protein